MRQTERYQHGGHLPIKGVYYDGGGFVLTKLSGNMTLIIIHFDEMKLALLSYSCPCPGLVYFLFL